MEQSSMAAKQINNELHVLFLPYFTPSHMIPLVNAARLFASHGGVKVTIITTPSNAALFRPETDHDTIKLGHKINVITLNFPAAEVGLPEGIENFSSANSMEMLSKVGEGIFLLQKPMENLILEIHPHCIFSDMFYPWTNDLAQRMNIPRLLFHPTNFIYHCLSHNLELYEPHKKLNSDSESFLIPDLPDKIEMKGSQIEEYLKTTKTPFGEILRIIKESELHCYGVVHDTIYELESEYVDYYKNIKGKKYWTIGPLFHFSNREIDHHRHKYLFDWLDSQEINEVLLICFGSLVRFSESQLKQIALALESTNQKFIWVVRNTEENWLKDGFEERLRNSKRGLIVRNWAPQLKILRHSSIGGFMTHCGWNSILEAITSGVPSITWPLFAEQFYNEKLIEILGLGIGVGANVWHLAPIIKSVVGSERIEEAMKRLMDYGSEESKKIRQNSNKMKDIANKAVEEGGSSYENLVYLIKELKSCAFGLN